MERQRRKEGTGKKGQERGEEIVPELVFRVVPAIYNWKTITGNGDDGDGGVWVEISILAECCISGMV